MAGLAVNPVVAGAAAQAVVLVTTKQEVGCAAASQRVLARAALHAVAATAAARQAVIASFAKQRIALQAADQDVVAVAPADGVVTPHADDITGQAAVVAVEDVALRPAAAVDGVVAVGQGFGSGHIAKADVHRFAVGCAHHHRGAAALALLPAFEDAQAADVGRGLTGDGHRCCCSGGGVDVVEPALGVQPGQAPTAAQIQADQGRLRAQLPHRRGHQGARVELQQVLLAVGARKVDGAGRQGGDHRIGQVW